MPSQGYADQARFAPFVFMLPSCPETYTAGRVHHFDQALAHLIPPTAIGNFVPANATVQNLLAAGQAENLIDEDRAYARARQNGSIIINVAADGSQSTTAI